MSRLHPLLILLVATSLVWAGSGLAAGPQVIDLGGVGLLPTLTISEAYDDNIWEASGIDSDSIKSSWVTQVSPQLSLIAKDRLNEYQLSYGLQHSIYHSSQADNKTENTLVARSHMEFTHRHRLDLNAGYKNRQEMRDSTNRAPINNESGNKYHTTHLEGLYGFGAKAATMQIEAGASQAWKRYTNNRHTGSQTHEQDHDTTTLLTRAYYRLGAKTKLLGEVQHSRYRYPTGPLDSKAWQYLVGGSWQPTVSTGVQLKGGIENKKFDDPKLHDPTNTVWEADVHWQPKTYSRLVINTRSYIEEGSATEEYIDTREYGAKWEQEWTPRIKSNLSYAFIKKNYQRPNTAQSDINRKDKLNVYSAGVHYKMRPWLTIGADYSYQDNNSTLMNENYDRNRIGLNVNVNL